VRVSASSFEVRAFAAFVFVGAAPAHAQALREPAAIERTIPTQDQRLASVPATKSPVPSKRDSKSSADQFTLGAVNIDGATVYSQHDLSTYFEPYLATEVDPSKLSEIANAITARYRHAGFILSYATVPPQKVDAGMVRLAVVEGRINDLIIGGAGPAQASVEAIAAPLERDRPLRAATLERTLGLIRDYPGLKVTDVALLRSDEDASLFRLRISMVQDRARAFTYFDNRGSDNAGHLRAYNSFSFSSLGVPGDELRVDLFAMPGGHSRYLYGQAYGSIALTSSGLRLSLNASRGDQYLSANEKFVGKSTNVFAQLSYPLLRSRAFSVVAKTSIGQSQTTGTQARKHQLRDRLHVLRAGADFSAEGRTHLQGELVLSRGLGFGGMTQVGDPLASRRDASGRFIKLSFSLQAMRALSDRVTLRSILLAQYSNRPLLSAEEFSLGGNRVGRAFDFKYEAADRGAGAGLEIGYKLGSDKDPTGLELFAFGDGGFVREVRSATQLSARRELASVGTGARFTLFSTTLSIEGGIPVACSRKDSPRVFISAFRSF
jgi:hemolysin activation/secretion protein